MGTWWPVPLPPRPPTQHPSLPCSSQILPGCSPGCSVAGATATLLSLYYPHRQQMSRFLRELALLATSARNQSKDVSLFLKLLKNWDSAACERGHFYRGQDSPPFARASSSSLFLFSTTTEKQINYKMADTASLAKWKASVVSRTNTQAALSTYLALSSNSNWNKLFGQQTTCAQMWYCTAQMAWQTQPS